MCSKTASISSSPIHSESILTTTENSCSNKKRLFFLTRRRTRTPGRSSYYPGPPDDDHHLLVPPLPPVRHLLAVALLAGEAVGVEDPENAKQEKKQEYRVRGQIPTYGELISIDFGIVIFLLL